MSDKKNDNEGILEIIDGRPETLQNSNDDDEASILHEAKLLFQIAIPTVAVQFSAYFIYPQTASAVGRNLGTEELAGFSLASLTGNLLCLSVIVGALSALDTLMPRAFGTKHYPEVGKLAIRGFLVCTLVLLIPIIPLVTSVESIFDALGQDPIASALASEWIRIYFLGVPFVLLYRVIQRFLASQQIVMPIAYAGLIGCFVVHPLLLRWILPSFGFRGSAGAIVMTQFVQAMLVVVYLKVRPVYHAETWKGLDWNIVKNAVEPKPMMEFFQLSMGGVVSLSEWWFWVSMIVSVLPYYSISMLSFYITSLNMLSYTSFSLL